jgi:hypothetical protein
MMIEYQPVNSEDIGEPCYVLADTLIDALRQSNGLEFMPLDQRVALIAELSKPVPFVP